MKIPFCLLSLAAIVLAAGCGDKSSKSGSASPSTNSSASSGNPLTAPVDYLSAAGKAQQSAVKTVDVTSVNQAIQLFNVERGRYPKDLNELVQEKFISKIPAAPYGMKIVYDANSGKASVVKQ